MADLIAYLIASGSSTTLFAAAGGILPALFWLWFWVQEDKLHPEPRGRLLATFLGGMAVVIIAYPFERMAYDYFGGVNSSTLLIWAAVEELLKYMVVGFIVLRCRDYDEPIDAMIYMVTAALGFAALENTIFILNPLLGGHAIQGLAAGNERFIGASLLHVVCSAILGFFIAREFYRSRLAKTLWRVVGLIFAIALHTLFNLFIIYEDGSRTFLVFAFVWVAALVVLLLFEKVKKIKS